MYINQGQLRNKIINRIMVYSGVLILTNYLIWNTPEIKWKNLYVLQLIIILIFIALIFFRKRLPINLKINLCSGVLALQGFMELLGANLFAFIFFYFISILLIGLLSGRKDTFKYSIIIFISVSLVLANYVLEIIKVPIDFNKYQFTANSWLILFIDSLYCILLVLTYSEYVSQSIQISEKWSENEIKLSQEKFSLAFKTSPDAITISSIINGLFLEVNEGFCTLTGYSPEEIIGKDVADIKFWANSNDMNILIQNLNENRQISNIETSLLCKDGKIKQGLTSIAVFLLRGEKCILSITKDITEKKRIEKDLKNSEEILKTTLESINDGLLIVSANLRFTHFNTRFREIFNVPDEISSITDDNILLEHAKKQLIDPESFSKQVKEIYNTNKPTEDILYFKNNTIVERLSYPLHEESPVKGRVWLFRDITEKNKTENALKESEERNRVIINNLPIVIQKSGVNGDLLFISESVEKVIGFTASEISNDVTKYWFNRIHPEDLQLVMDSFGKLSKENVPFNIEYRYKTKAGNWIWLHDFANVILDESGRVNILGVFHDITRRKLAEQSHMESEERFKLLSEATFEAVVLHRDGKIFDINNQAQNLFGYNLSELKKKNLEDFIYGADIMIMRNHINKQDDSTYVVRGLKKNGTLLYLEVHAKNIKIDNENYRLAVLRDITSYKNIELSLRSSEERFRNIFNSVTDAVFIVDFNCNILEVNDIAVNQLGYNKAEFSKMSFNNFFGDESSGKFSNINEILKSNKLRTFETEITTRNGNKIPIELSIKKIQFNQKDAFITVSHDITERKQFQHKLLEAMVKSEEKERERYAKEIHDGLGPILSTCKIYFHSINTTTDAAKRKEHVIRTSELLEDALRSVKEISNNLSPHILRNYGLLQALYSFSKRLEMIAGLNFTINSNITSRLDDIVELTLYRVLIELINNTIKHSSADQIGISINKINNGLFVEYSDNGKGFDYEMVKKQDKGFGLTNIENRIIKIDGKYNFNSSPGMGVKVTIILNL